MNRFLSRCEKICFRFNHSIVGHRRWLSTTWHRTKETKKEDENRRILRDPFQINHTGEITKTAAISRPAKSPKNQTAPGKRRTGGGARWRMGTADESMAFSLLFTVSYGTSYQFWECFFIGTIAESEQERNLEL